MRLLPLLRLVAALSLSLPAFAQDPALAGANARIQAAVDSGQSSSPFAHDALATRRDLLLQLFRTHPAQARANALPLSTRQALLAADPAAAPYLERELTSTGELSTAVADDFTGHTSSTRLSLHTPTADLDLSLPATLLALAPANHHLVTVQGLALGDVIAAERLSEATPTEAAACEAPTRTIAATGGAAPLTCSTFGVQRIAVLIVKFPGVAAPTYPNGLDQPTYWNQVLFGAAPSVNNYWNEVSQGQTSATGDVFGPFQLPGQYDCTTTNAMQAAAIAAAAPTVDFSQYNRILIVFPAAPTCNFGGLGNVGCVSATTTINHQYSVVWIPITPGYTPTFPQMWGGTSHELGHNLGLNHANTLDFDALSLGPLDFSTTSTGAVSGYGGNTGSGSNLAAVNTEYGDHFDVMGYPWTSGGPYNAVHRTKILGWIPQTDSRDITSAGTYTLAPAENSSGLRSLHVLRDATSTSWLWVEFHQASSFYEAQNLSAFLTSGDTETTGAQIHYEAPIGSSSYTYLLDMTPVASATTGTNNFYDGTLAPGKSWSDPYSLLTLTAGAQTSAGLGVTVAYDTPCATLTLSSSTVPAAGGTGSLTLAAPATCTWTVGSNAPWITFPGATSGSGPAVIPFTAAANTTLLQRNTYLTAQRQSLPLLQPGGAITLAGIAPTSGTSVAGSATPFTLSFADARGLPDLLQINLDFSGFGTPDCQVTAVPVSNGTAAYLYLYSAAGFTNGVLAGSAATLATPSCTLNAATSTYRTSGTNGTLTLALTFTTSFLGEHNITANASSATTTGTVNANTGALPLGVWTVRAIAASTTATLSASPASPSTYGQAVTFAVNIAPASATGSVTFTLDGQPGGTVAVLNGSSSLVLPQLAVGTHTVSATYLGDTANAPSTSSTLTYIVNAAPIATTTRLFVATPQPVSYGTTVTLQATVFPAAATGTITFFEGTTNLGSAPLAPTQNNLVTATLALPNLPAGAHTMTAVYSGDSTFAASTATASPFIINPQAAKMALSPSALSTPLGNPLTLTATLTPATATGTVTFYETQALTLTTTLGTGIISNGIATFTTNSLPVGNHSLTAIYGGDNNTGTVQSGFLLVTVTPTPGTSTTLAASTGAIVPGGSFTLTARAAPAAGATVPTGNVTFLEGATTLATLPLVNGSATYTATPSTVGTHSYTASYAGSPGTFAPSLSAPALVAVQDFALSIPSASATVNAGTGESFPLTLTPVAASFAFPIALTCTGAPAQSTCTVSPTTLTPGSNPATATVTLTTTARPSGQSGWLLLTLAPGLLAFRRRHRKLLLALAAFATLTLAGGCGKGNFTGDTFSGTPAGTYTLTLTATATTLTHAVPLTLKIN